VTTGPERESQVKLSANFSLWEVVCPCCGKSKHDNRLIIALEQLRELGCEYRKEGTPITVLSGVRCSTWNSRCGGVPQSQHLVGRAADIVMRGLHPYEMESLAEQVWLFSHGGIGVYPHRGFIHVDVRLGGSARWRG